MSPRQYATLCMLLLSACAGSYAGTQKKEQLSSRDEAAQMPFDYYFTHVEPRKRLIEEELRKGSLEPWEGVFSDGGLRGLSMSWIISRKAGYVSTSKSIDMGKVVVKGNRIALVSESLGKPWGLKPYYEYVVVPWSERVYLVEPDQLLGFCNDVNSGRLRSPSSPWSGYPTRPEDLGKKLMGMPKVPDEYKEYLLKEPVSGSIIKRRGNKGDVAVLGKKNLRSGFSVTLDVGKRDGVRTGMVFYAKREPGRHFNEDIYVISVTEAECELLVDCESKAKRRFRVGARLTTNNSLYTDD